MSKIDLPVDPDELAVPERGYRALPDWLPVIAALALAALVWSGVLPRIPW